MKKLCNFLLSILLMSLLGTASARGQTFTLTPNIGLQVPGYNQANWQVPLNYDLNRLDALLSGNLTLPALNAATITGANFCIGSNCISSWPGAVGLGNGVQVIDASLQAGVASAKINLAIAALPSSGTTGTVDARALIGNQTFSATVTIPRGVTVLLGCGLNATYTATPVFVGGNVVGCGGRQSNPQTLFTASGTIGGSAVQNVNLYGVAFVGASVTDGSIGFDGTSGWQSGQLINSSFSTYQYPVKIGGGGSESSYNHVEDVQAYGAGTYGFWVVGNAAYNEFEHLTTTGLHTCYEFDAPVSTAINLDCESFLTDAVGFNSSGNQVFGLYAESGVNVLHFKSGNNNVVIGGHATSVSAGTVYDSNVDQISNYQMNVDYGGGPQFPSYWPTTYLEFSFPALSDPIVTELAPGLSWGGTGTGVWQALRYSPNSTSHGPAQGYIGYAPIGLGAIETRGGINLWGSLLLGGLPSGTSFNAPTLSCDSPSPSGTTYTAYLVITDFNGNKTLPSIAGTIKCTNPPSVSHPISVTPTTNWFGNPVAGVRNYDYLWGDTSHSFALAALGPQVYEGSVATPLSSYTAPTRNGTGDLMMSNSVAASNCGSLTSAAGCLAVQVWNGSAYVVHYVPYY